MESLFEGVATAHPTGSVDAWKETAVAALCDFCDGHVGEDHLAEEIRAAAEANGVARLDDARAWGQIMKMAEKRGVIKRVGYAPTASSNGSPKALWRMIGGEGK